MFQGRATAIQECKDGGENVVNVNRFRGEYFFLSNMYPCRVVLDGIDYPSVENAYQAAKTAALEMRKPFEEYSPRVSKRMGRKLVIRANWILIRLGIMEMLVRQKFVDYTDLGWALTQIKGRIEEGNTCGDKFWGVCDGDGENHLGRILMNIRGDIIAGDPGGMKCLHHDHFGEGKGELSNRQLMPIKAFREKDISKS